MMSIGNGDSFTPKLTTTLKDLPLHCRTVDSLRPSRTVSGSIVVRESSHLRNIHGCSGSGVGLEVESHNVYL